jgi:glycosyltransferase involved in cell wall biosynthesis
VPVRILHVLEATIGGTREHLLQIAERLDARRFELSFAVSTLRDPRFTRDIERLRRRGFAVHVIPMKRAIRPVSDAACLWRLWRLMRRERFDVVHTHGSKAGILGRVAARLARVPRVIHTGHTFAFQWNRGLKGSFFVAIERLAARLADTIIAVSPAQKALALSLRLCPERKLVVIENGVDVSRHPAAIDKAAKRAQLDLTSVGLLVGMVARLVPQKGCEHYVDAALRVLTHRSDVQFLLIGEGELEGRIRGQIARLRITDHVKLLGHRDDAAEIYPLLDVFVLSSLWEGLPYAVLEAMAAGLPVVASRVPGVEDIVRHGETGYLTNIEDPDDIAGRILELLADEGLRERMGRRGRELVEQHYTIDEFIGRLSELYNGVGRGDAL